jgi:hypothetical protein
VQELYAVLRDPTEAAFGREQTEVELAPILKVSAEVMVTELLREVRVDQIKQDTKIIDDWKKRLISLIGRRKKFRTSARRCSGPVLSSHTVQVAYISVQAFVECTILACHLYIR